MAIQLGFTIERGRGAYPAKIREDGRVGTCVGDEALLWDAYQEACARAEGCLRASQAAEAMLAGVEAASQEARAELEALRKENAEWKAAYQEARDERELLRRENADLKVQLEQRKGRR